MLRRSTLVLAGLALATSVSLQAGPASAAPGAGPLAAEPYDFDGDGTPDLVVGADALQVGSVPRAGGVSVLRGTSNGPSTHAARTLTAVTAGVPGSPTTGYRFGAAVASADFDGDGFADLAVGVPADDVGGDEEAAGSVTVFPGSFAGLTGKGSYVLTRAGAATDDGFGAALAAADLDGDGRPELVVGAPYIEDGDGDQDASGSVTVFHGTSGRFSNARSTVLHGVREGADLDDEFGSSLAVGDVDDEAGTDLVVGSRGAPSADGDGHAGAVSVCHAGTSCHQLASKPGYAGLSSLAVGNVSGSARSEIVFGVVPGPDSDPTGGGSVVTLALSGRGSGLSARATTLTQDSPGVPGADEPGDEFGYALALADLDGDGYADLVAGAPGESLRGHAAAGRVTVIHGGPEGYRRSGNTTISQSTTRVPGKAERGDRFGAALVLSDTDADGHPDLAVGAPGENASGAVTTLAGSGRTITTRGSRAFDLKSLGQGHRRHAGFGGVLG